MSDDDLLDRAARALRDESKTTPRDLAATRARLLADARRSRVHTLGARARVVRWVVPLAAVLALGTAYAAATGQLRTFLGLGRGREAPTATVASATASTPVPDRAPAPAPTPVPAIVASAESAPSVVASAVASPAPSVAPSTTTSAVASGIASAPPAPSVKPSASNDNAAAMAADLASYRKAHALHFVEKRWDAALGAWNEYLADHGKGTFVVEARYNRAICLVKLGRKSDARIALQPFADGTVAGGYRKDEAKALLDALDAP